MKIILIIGLPASGKTYYANTLGIPVIDDITSLDQLPNTGDFVITDPYFCNSIILNKAIDILRKKYPSATISLKYFENDPVQAKHNAMERTEFKQVSGFINYLSTIYNPPTDQHLIPVYNGTLK